MPLAYLINQYPHTSHSFIRREIAALEAAGLAVQRFSIRPPDPNLPDPADREEISRTRALLAAGPLALAFSTFRRALAAPRTFVKALGLALSLGRRSDRGLLRHLIYLAEAAHLADLLRAGHIDHLHAHFGTNSATVALLCHALGGPPYSFTVHGPEEFDRPESLSLTKKIESAAFVIAISHFGRSQLYRWCCHEHWSKIHVVRCGVDQAFLDHPSVRIPSAPRLVCVGRLCEQKGQLLLVQAAAQLAAEGLKFQIILVGDGPMRPDIQALIDQHALHDSVKLAGWMSGPEVRAQILNSRALVLPSFAEGLPVVIMEALALGRPVISTTIAAIPELLEPGKSGWLIPPGALEPLVSALRFALTTPPSHLEAMGRHGARRVAEYHNAATEAQTLASLFPHPPTKPLSPEPLLSLRP